MRAIFGSYLWVKVSMLTGPYARAFLMMINAKE